MISYNAHKEDNDLKGHVQRLAPNVLLVLANYGLAHDMAVTNPHTQIIFRPYFGRDDIHNFMSTNTFIAHCRQWWQGEPNIWFHTANEAGMSIEMLDWEMRLASTAPVGMKFVFANPSSGSFPDNPQAWEYAHDYIRFCIVHKDRIMIGLHEYFDVTPTITMPNWINRIVEPFTGEVRPAYHCGRFRALTDYCDQNFDGEYPNIVITEAGNDDVTENRDGSDVNAFLATLGFKPRGWHTLKAIWQGWYGRQPDITYFRMFKWLVENVYNHPAIRGICIFAWTSDDAPQWGKFNMSSATNFINLNEGYNAKPAPIIRTAVVTSNYRTNVRASGNTTSKILTKVSSGAVIQVYDVMVGDWYQVIVDGVVGFIRKDVIQLSYGMKVVSTAAYNVIVRDAPSLSGAWIGRVYSGKEFIIYGTDDQWVRVVSNGVMGWANAAVLDYKETP